MKKIKNRQPQTKFTGSYKKMSVYHKINLSPVRQSEIFQVQVQ